MPLPSLLCFPVWPCPALPRLASPRLPISSHLFRSDLTVLEGSGVRLLGSFVQPIVHVTCALVSVCRSNSASCHVVGVCESFAFDLVSVQIIHAAAVVGGGTLSKELQLTLSTARAGRAVSTRSKLIILTRAANEGGKYQRHN